MIDDLHLKFFGYRCLEVYHLLSGRVDELEYARVQT